jgi:alkyl hydroperoxide reductase subunit AhpC
MEHPMRIAAIIAFTAALALADDLPKALQGNEIPGFSLSTLDNKLENRLDRDKLKEAAKKPGTKRIALSFFDTRCAICEEEFALLRKNESELEKNGVQVYLISVGESVHDKGADVERFVKTYAGDAAAVSFPFYFDPNVVMFKNFGLGDRKDYRLPAVVVLDADLKALAVFRGKIENFPQVLWSGL